ncbi:glucuronate isomerase [Aliifodinibius sp. S!AR15-10]|uniref:glucuronate isomerase n=1 Tax=Aliifodinibius sp. S!AR15-10 TaxID=2950437 RepID=UPI0028577D71|nr:glucuronate isomerase [Aliifodinibius sp. S!AR15-10]MDR8394608.1 glucuronate isomerase [Aliifodinibius sp. S!AR15-10]
MSHFITDDFLLQNKHAQTLYHEYAAGQPIIDYHCHLPPADIAEDRQFKNLTKIWLDGDHYKWRAMRTLGVDEKFVTGDTSDKEKFAKWAETVPYTLRNPLHHWTHLELKRYFGVDQLLSPETADEIYNSCTEKLQDPAFSARGLLRQMNVRVVCTTDDPADSLKHHRKIAEDDFEIDVLPGFRPDAAYNFSDPASYNEYLSRLEEASGISIDKYEDLIEALFDRIDFFEAHGCGLSDHGIKTLQGKPIGKKKAKKYFDKIRSGDELSIEKQQSLRYVILLELCRRYAEKGWVQQFHLGALRNANSRMMEELGPDTGFDSIGDYQQADAMAKFFDELDSTDQLSKTVIYNLNPSDNAIFATMIGNFNDGSTRGKMQFGSAWWFLDQQDGMEEQMNVLSNMGLLSCFIGMLTDSRSFLSYPRHEYFRRTLCNLLGKDLEAGLLPDDMEWTGKIVSDICYHNAKSYFKF